MLRKPSMFSNDYNKVMKRRKITFLIGSIIIFLILIFLMWAFSKNISLSEFKERIFTGDKENAINKTEEIEDDSNVESDEVSLEKNTSLELPVSEGNIINVDYEEIDGTKEFKEISYIPENMECDISPSNKFIVVRDDLQNIKLYNTEKDVSDLTKKEYVAKNGEEYSKEWALNTSENYVWSKNVKFISDDKIVFLSNLPYFGQELEQYVWVLDINSKEYTTLWELKGKKVEFGDITEKGLEVDIDGKIKYINSLGKVIK